MAFSTARTMTPTSAKTASHIFAMPSAPRARQASFTPREKARVFVNGRKVLVMPIPDYAGYDLSGKKSNQEGPWELRHSHAPLRAGAAPAAEYPKFSAG